MIRMWNCKQCFDVITIFKRNLMGALICDQGGNARAARMAAARAKTRRPSSSSTIDMPSGGGIRSCNTSDPDEAPGLPPISLTIANFARLFSA